MGIHPVDAALERIGLDLPEAAAPVANYVPAVPAAGPLLFISGQLPMTGGKPSAVGRVGEAVTVEEGYDAARLCALNILAQVRTAVAGDWNRVAHCVKLTGFVAAGVDFADHPKVINGASDLMVAVLGEAGTHSRSAVGVSGLPFGASVEVEAIFELAPV